MHIPCRVGPCLLFLMLNMEASITWEGIMHVSGKLKLSCGKDCTVLYSDITIVVIQRSPHAALE